MFANARETIIKILALYIGTSAVFLCIGFYYIGNEKIENIIFMQMANLRDVSFEFHHIVRKNNGDINRAISEAQGIINMPFAIYDRENKLLFSSLSTTLSDDEIRQGFCNKNGRIFANPDAHKGRKARPMPYKIILEDTSLDGQILLAWLEMGLYFVLILTLMGIVAGILVKLFLKPLSSYIQALDAFIKDTTHEINTPLSVILMSIETLKTGDFAPSEAKKLERIRIASLQLSQIYSDLVAHNFPHSLQNDSADLSLDTLLQERLEFFAPFFAQKKLIVESSIESAHFHASKEKFRLIFDNLLSNAVKYTPKGGEIRIALKNGEFRISDSGKGIEPKNLDKIYVRYTRFSEDKGGFGIGLFLVKKICNEYHIRIHTDSSPQGTTFTLRWEANPA